MIVDTNNDTDDGMLEDLVSEAERRFARAKYYEALIREPIFDGDDSPVAASVVEEIRAFSRNRLSVLLGLKGQSAPDEFSPEEIKALKALAKRAMTQSRGVTEPTEPTAMPTIRKVRGVGSPKKATTKVTDSVTASKGAQAPEVTKPATVSGEVLEIPNKDGTSRKYTKTIEDGEEYYLGENGYRYALATNAAGEHFMRSIQQQARPSQNSVIKPIPPLNANAMAAIASAHAAVMEKKNPMNNPQAANVAWFNDGRGE